jgi:hypothetical protein
VKPQDSDADPAPSLAAAADPLALVRRALSSLRFGEVTITVHDGEIVQVSRTEKLRPPRRTPDSPPREGPPTTPARRPDDPRRRTT